MFTLKHKNTKDFIHFINHIMNVPDKYVQLLQHLLKLGHSCLLYLINFTTKLPKQKGDEIKSFGKVNHIKRKLHYISEHRNRKTLV